MIRRILRLLLMRWQKAIYKQTAINKYNRKVDEATELYLKNHEKVYVMPRSDGELVICNRKGFRIAKSNRKVPAQASMADIKKGCIYATPSGFGVNAMPEHEVKARRGWYLKFYCECKLKI